MTLEKTILRVDVLRLMDQGDPFDLVFVTADRKRGTGGDIRSVEGFKKIISGQPSDERLPGEFKKFSTTTSRNPNHKQHKTINIYDPENPDQHAITVHFRLMIYFNSQRIIG